MSNNRKNPITQYDRGFLQGLTDRIKLIYLLMTDRRVSPLLKLLPLSSVVYFLFPDLMPGPIDDAVLIWLSTYLFVELCPSDVVEEHQNTIDRVIPGQMRDAPPESNSDVIDGDVIDADYTEQK